jgi:hypothetical protein
MRFSIGPTGSVEALATPLADGPTYHHNPGDLIFVRLPAGKPGPSSPDERSNRTGDHDGQQQR